MDKIVFFFDGFNLYHALSDHGLDRFKWLNLRKLAEHLVRPQQRIVDILYFTAYTPHSHQKRLRQQHYLAALESVGVKIVLGRFKSRDRWCGTCKTRYSTFEEKKQM